MISRYTRFGSFKVNGFLFSSYPKYLRFFPTLTTLFSRATFSKTLTIKLVFVTIKVKEIEESILFNQSGSMFRKKFEKNAIDAGSPTNFAVAPEK